ncbi:DNA-3-methyladenine glycosylase [Candidatus Bathyarchaeota archaeon]|nr:DNA-3-methyladenine glycosylase [Candidatus Bathyarchaeota archaeon]
MDARFFDRDPAKVAKELIGAVLMRKIGSSTYQGRIVETEAYYASGDPASRAREGPKNYNRPMFDGAGHLFVYNVHQYWMLNFTARPASAVLIRSVEPLNFKGNPSGPGRLTVTLKIDKSLNGHPIHKSSGVWLEDGSPPDEVARSFRIGVTKDLPIPLRFFDPASGWVSATRKPVLIESFTG